MEGCERGWDEALVGDLIWGDLGMVVPVSRVHGDCVSVEGGSLVIDVGGRASSLTADVAILNFDV